MNPILAGFAIEFAYNKSTFKAFVEQIIFTNEIEILHVIGGNKAIKIKTNRPFKINHPGSVRKLKFQVMNYRINEMA